MYLVSKDMMTLTLCDPIKVKIQINFVLIAVYADGLGVANFEF